MGVLCFIYMICALRTNVVFVVIFLSLVVAFGLLAGAFFLQAADYAANAAAANRCLVVSSPLSPLHLVCRYTCLVTFCKKEREREKDKGKLPRCRESS